MKPFAVNGALKIDSPSDVALNAATRPSKRNLCVQHLSMAREIPQGSHRVEASYALGRFPHCPPWEIPRSRGLERI
jgi:hypothetical protein